MRFFDEDKVGVYLDGINHRVEKTSDGKELKMIDLTLRVQPLTPQLAGSCHPDVRALLFTMGTAEPKANLKSVEFKLPVPKQTITVHFLPADDGALVTAADDVAAIVLPDVEITSPRARTEKGVDGFGFVFYASLGPVSASELEYFCNWHTQQRFVTFQPDQPVLDFSASEPEVADAVARPRRVRG